MLGDEHYTVYDYTGKATHMKVRRYIIKSCAMCGSKYRHTTVQRSQGTMPFHHIGCSNFECPAFNGSSLYNSLEEAITAWNRRYPWWRRLLRWIRKGANLV